MLLPPDMANLMPHLVSITSETYSCVTAPVQHAACVAFDMGDEVQRAVRDAALERTGVAVLPGRAFGVNAAALAVRVATVDYDGAVVLAGLRQHRPGTPAARRAFVHHHSPRLTDGVTRMREYIARICQS